MSKSKNPGKAALVQHHDDDGEVVVAPSRQIERAPDISHQPRPPKRPNKRAANLLGSDFHPVETSRGLMPLYGLATKLPEPQQKKVARLLTLVAYKFKKRRLAREFANHGKGELL